MADPATYPVGTIAKLLVLTERQVQSLAAQGMLPKAERGRYELVPVVQAYVRYLRDRTLGADAENDDIGNLKARMIKARARMAEMEADQMDGTLLRRTAVEAAWGAMVGNMRSRLLSIPNKCAPLAQTAASLAEASAAITAAVHEALTEVSRTPVYARRDPGESAAGADGDGGSDAAHSGTAAETDGL